MFNPFKKETINSSVSVNGQVFTGKNITVKNNKVIIDGVLVKTDDKIINIVVNGNIDTIDVDTCEKIEVHGNTQNATTTNGSISVSGDVLNSVKTTNGSVKIGGSVTGNVKTTNGSIKHN